MPVTSEEVRLRNKLKNLTDRLLLKQKSLANSEQRLRNIKQGKGHSSKVFDYGKGIKTGKHTYSPIKPQSTKNVVTINQNGIKKRNKEIAELKERIQEVKSKLRILKPELNNTAESKLDDVKNKYKNFIIKAMANTEPKIRLAKNVSDLLPEEDTCVVLSIAFLINKDPNDVWAVAKNYWRSRGGITQAHQGSILREFGYGLKSRYDLAFYKKVDKKSIFKTPVPTRITFGKLLQILDKDPEASKAFLINVENHAIGIKNHKVLDTANTGDKKKVYFVNELTKL